VLLNLSVADPDAKKLLGCLLTQQAEAVAKSRGALTEQQQNKRYVIIIDEVQNYVYQSGQALENMFAEARKANLSVWVAHQYGEQLSETLHGALSQCGIIVVFKVGRQDALASVDQLEFPIDTHWVKQETGDPFSLAGTRKQYYSAEELRGIWAGCIQNLREREAFIRLPGNNRLYQMRTLDVPQHVDTERLAEVEQEYLRRYFRPKTEIDREIEETLAELTASQDTKQRATLPQTARPTRSIVTEQRSSTPLIPRKSTKTVVSAARDQDQSTDTKEQEKEPPDRNKDIPVQEDEYDKW
jgi:hypothetical protein